MLQWKPSLVAAAAVYLAKRNETLDAWVRQVKSSQVSKSLCSRLGGRGIGRLLGAAAPPIRANQPHPNSKQTDWTHPNQPTPPHLHPPTHQRTI
jgi:hypothetical protein